MRTRQGARSVFVIGAWLSLGVAVSACGVSRSDHDADISALQSEIQRLDQRDAEIAGQASTAQSSAAELDQRVGALEASVNELEGRMGEIEQLAADAIRFNAPVYFGYDSDEVRDEDKATLDRFASVVNRFYSGATITIEGFADPAGDADYNMDLGRRRAEAVKAYLVSAGVAEAQLRVDTHGEARNRQINSGAWGEEGMANRRVAFVVDYREGM